MEITNKAIQLFKQQRKEFIAHLVHTRDRYFPNFQFFKPHKRFVFAFCRALLTQQHILINCPPRIGKTETFRLLVIASLTFPNFKDLKILYVCYSDDLAANFSNLIKRVLEEDYELIEGKGKQNELQIAATNNYLYSRGIGGSITGRGFDIIIIDDLYKGWDDVRNPKYTQKLIDFYQVGLVTRLNNPQYGSIFCIMTRWTKQDFCNYLVKEQDFKNIKIPALNKNQESNFHPFKTTEDFLRIKEQIGALEFESLYQQNPLESIETYLTKEELNIIDPEEVPTSPDVSFCIIDTTYKANSSSDFFALILYYKKDNKIYLVEALQKKLTAKEQEDFILDYIKLKNVHYVFVEDAGHGNYLIQKYKFRGLKTKNKNKEARFLEAIPIIKQKLYIPRNQKLIIDYLITYPNVQNDDLIDCVSYLAQVEVASPNRKVVLNRSIENFL
jgi:predicted phage terminase large subunit-like protein